MLPGVTHLIAGMIIAWIDKGVFKTIALKYIASQSRIRYVFSKLIFIKTGFRIHGWLYCSESWLPYNQIPYLYFSFLRKNTSFCELLQFSSILEGKWLTPTFIEPQQHKNKIVVSDFIFLWATIKILSISLEKYFLGEIMPVA